MCDSGGVYPGGGERKPTAFLLQGIFFLIIDTYTIRALLNMILLS